MRKMLEQVDRDESYLNGLLEADVSPTRKERKSFLMRLASESKKYEAGTKLGELSKDQVSKVRFIKK